MKKGFNILGFGEIMMRLSPPNKDIIENASTFEVNYGGAECNVISSMAKFGNSLLKYLMIV